MSARRLADKALCPPGVLPAMLLQCVKIIAADPGAARLMYSARCKWGFPLPRWIFTLSERFPKIIWWYLRKKYVTL